jgi:iron complex outermembrane receptor protein
MVYASLVRGYRAGGFNSNASSQSSAQIAYDPEYTWNYELGLRSRWCEHKLGLDLTGFYTDWRDQQVFTSMAPYDVAVVNASRSHVMGAELELAWRERVGVSLWANAGVMQAEFDERSGQVTHTNGGVTTVDTVDYAGKRFALVPETTWALGAAYAHACGVFTRVDWHGQGWSYVDDENTERADPVALLDARVGWAGAWCSIALVGRNLTDEDYITNSFFLPGDFISTSDTTYVRLGESRSIGVEVSAWW